MLLPSCAPAPVKHPPVGQASHYSTIPKTAGATAPAKASGMAGGDAGIRFTFGAPAPEVAGFRRIHR